MFSAKTVPPVEMISSDAGGISSAQTVSRRDDCRRMAADMEVKLCDKNDDRDVTLTPTFPRRLIFSKPCISFKSSPPYNRYEFTEEDVGLPENN
mmetsp:Transcript_50168/g.50520  ORF Transcript_50168/g.50520 Transcript_50168/m.50520 type:complete len:94 (+) Transcript_50168:979-1260(+)